MTQSPPTTATGDCFAQPGVAAPAVELQESSRLRASCRAIAWPRIQLSDAEPQTIPVVAKRFSGRASADACFVAIALASSATGDRSKQSRAPAPSGAWFTPRAVTPAESAAGSSAVRSTGTYGKARLMAMPWSADRRFHRLIGVTRIRASDSPPPRRCRPYPQFDITEQHPPRSTVCRTVSRRSDGELGTRQGRACTRRTPRQSFRARSSWHDR